MVVQHNLTAMNANRYLGINNSKLSKSLEKLSSGYAINRAGDNAAGLAVSEKMRSQIAGMTQGVKNAQDGISMVQTFEGALTETDSILQRMKTLADQAANGTYQDDVDRDAIQLEFDQLNDELNQIADTDFNGVVVLNGGQMADGTVAVDGKFDYSLGRTTTVVANEAKDLSGTAKPGQAHTMVEQGNYDKEIADAVWNALGADVDKVQDLKVTFMYDGDRWMAQTVTTTDAKTGKDVVVDGARASGLEAREVERDGATGKGGFEVVAGKDPYTGKDIIATNVIFDEMKSVDGEGLNRGDTITVQFQNSKATTYAPKNAGLDECKDKDTGKPFKFDAATTTAVTNGTSTLTSEALTGKVGFTLDSSITDGAMSKKTENILKALDQLDFDVTYQDGAMKTIAKNADSETAIADAAVKAIAGNITVEGNNVIYGTGADKMVLGTFKTESIKVAVPEHDETTYSITTTDGTNTVANAGNNDNLTVTVSAANKQALLTQLDGKLKPEFTKIEIVTTNKPGTTCTVNGVAADGTKTELLTGAAVAGVAGTNNNDGCQGLSFEFALNAVTTTVPADTKGDEDADGKFTVGVNLDAFNYADMSKLSVHAVATPKIATMASQVAKEGVSKSNSYKNGSAPLTYTDNITLQTGARSKDAVNFTFKYTSGGMGNLKSNMNCSAREDGLNTASLSLKTAESANYAIDQIDNAINKVSMVRATFGAVQNRLEHKIDNMNVSIENLTSAESQIRDTNMPTEMMNFTKQQILAQASQSMLAQANQLPQSVLSLLQ